MAVKKGDHIPHFQGIDQNGNSFDSHDFKGKSLVVYFYPKDDTPGCTAQACNFRDQYQDFKDLGAEIIGISSDDVDSHRKFVQKYKLPFILISDTDKKIRKTFGVQRDYLGIIDGRTTYVVDKKGIIQLVFDSIFAKNHIEKAREILKRM